MSLLWKQKYWRAIRWKVLNFLLLCSCFNLFNIVAIAIRFNCTIEVIKRLNKIDKSNEIYSRKILKVPINSHSILLDTMPQVHKSGNNSPKSPDRLDSSRPQEPSTSSNGIFPADANTLEEKLFIASVSSASYQINQNGQREQKIEASPTAESLLLGEESSILPRQPATMRPLRNDFLSVNGSDCDVHWTCLLFFILALCVIIPLIYVYKVYEHPEEYHHGHIIYDSENIIKPHAEQIISTSKSRV